MVGKSERAERVAMQRSWSAAPAIQSMSAGSPALRRKPRSGVGPSSVTSSHRDRVASSDREPRTSSGAGFLRACLLLLVRERTGHGYELLSRLQRFGFDAADSGWLYRTLRRLEVDGLVSSSWETSGAGPARRVYELTAQGEASLRNAADALRAEVHASQSFLDRYRRVTQEGARRSLPRPELLPDRAF
jgi:PadR family transcriptional regulator